MQTIKDTLQRSFNWISNTDPDILRYATRPEWPAVIHNLCYLHGALHLRARFGRGGWNQPNDFLQIGNMELTVQ